MPAAAAGQKVTAAFLNSLCPLGEAQSVNNTTVGTTTSGTYTDTLSSSGTVTLNFTAPPSGVVDITIEAALWNSSVGFYTVASFRLSGASTVAATDDNQIYQHGTNEQRQMGRSRVSGLVAGGAYTATMQHKVSGGTGNYNHRRIAVTPIGA